MKLVSILFVILMLTNCSLNKDSQYWTENMIKKIKNQKKLSEILKRSEDITTMTFDEYEIYVDDHTNNSKFPDINQ